MVWYNPSTWFSPATTDVAPSPYMSTTTESPAAATSFGYGGKKRKTTRKGKKTSKRSRTGKRSTRS